jgi:branched-chain amino acid transport system substrate-binding protein
MHHPIGVLRTRTWRLAAAALGVAVAIAPAQAQAPVQAPIRIGAILELSGRFVSYGAACKRGIDMATATYGETVAGRKYEFVFRDVQSEARGTVSAFIELANTNHIDYIIGPIASPIVAAAIPPWQQTKPLWIVPGSSATELEEKAGQEPNFFHSYPYAYHYHHSLAAGLVHYLGPGKKLAMIYSDDSYGRTHVPAAEKYFKAAGFQIIAEEALRTNSPDMTPVLTRVARMKPDVLLAIVQTTDGITLTKQAYTMRIKIPYISALAAVKTPEWQQAVGEAQQGWIGISTFLPNTEDWPADKTYPNLFPGTKPWEAKFRERYGRDADDNELICYSNAIQLLLAMDKAGGGDDKSKVVAALRDLQVTTPMGPAAFAPSEGTKQQEFAELLVFQRQNGQNVILWPLQAANGKLVPIE